MVGLVRPGSGPEYAGKLERGVARFIEVRPGLGLIGMIGGWDGVVPLLLIGFGISRSMRRLNLNVLGCTKKIDLSVC